MAWARTSFVNILTPIYASLVTNTGLATTAIKLRSKRQWKFTADKILILVPQQLGRDAVVSDGSGRIMTALKRQLWVQCVCRLALDTIDDGTQFFTNTSYGLIPFEEQVLNALVEFQPINSAGTALTIEPIKFIGGVPPTQEVESVGWGQETLAFEITYAPALNQAYQ